MESPIPVMMTRICVTSCSHEAERSNELSYEQGDLVTLASELTEDGEHYQAVTSDGSMGLIHRSFILERVPIPLWPMPWFHSAISRLDAEKLLDRNQDGEFLLRTSQNTEGVYALAISHGGKINHYLVAMDFSSKKLTINGEKYFDNLPELVQVHTLDPGPLGGLLTHPVARRGVLNFYIDQKALKETWGLPKSQVELGDTLGRGEFGEVRVATYRETQVAAKVIHEDKHNDSTTSSFLQEAAVLTHLQHQNLVQLVGLVFQGSAMKCILTELMGKGSLQKYLISRGRAVVSSAELLGFSRGVCDGMVYISSQGFVHRDLAARNVLLNSNGQAKISDFGLARKAELYVPHEGGKFPVKWTAPESLKESKFSVESDVWSYGVLLWEIYSYGRSPYPSVPTSEVLENIEDGLIMDPPDHCPDHIYDLMCICWEMEPECRPSFLSIQYQLGRMTQDSCMPLNSPSPIISRKITDVKGLVSSPVAVKAYREAPVSRKAAMFLCNVIVLGPQGSGKTSLLRSLTGEPFRLVEPPSQRVAIMESYSLLTENMSWLPSTSGLVYEDELVRIIVEDLLKHMHSMLVKADVSAAQTSDLHQKMGGAEGPALPPQRRRSQSFCELRGEICDIRVDTLKDSKHLTGSFEGLAANSPEPEGNAKLQLSRRPRHRPFAKGKKNVLAKFLNRSFRHSPKTTKRVQRHYSDSAKHSHYTGHDATSNSSTPMPPPSFSPLPERLTEKIKRELSVCTDGSLPPKYLARLIDTPGHPSFRVLQDLFLTENSLCVLVFDASKDMLSPPGSSLSLKRKQSPEARQNGYGHPPPPQHTPEEPYLRHLMAELSNICVQWSGCKADMTICGPRIILVGTHSDKVPSSVSRRNFEILRDEIKASAYQKYVAGVKFVVSNSSLIERSSMDELKSFMKENIKKSCRQQVPLKWLRCVRRFQGLPKKKSYFMSLIDAKKLVSEICDISLKDPEIDEVINFLHQNQVILHFARVHNLRGLVICSAPWFAHHVSAVFSATFLDIEGELGPLELVADQERSKSTGILSSHLLDYIWKEKAVQLNKEELLTAMHKMDLLCCMPSDRHELIPLSASMEDLLADREVGTKRGQHRPKVAVSSLVVPGLVEEPEPARLSLLPSYDVDPILFHFKDHVPSGLFPRILVRCVQSYPKCFSLYRHSATFQVDERLLLLLREGRDSIRLTLHPIHRAFASSNGGKNADSSSTCSSQTSDFNGLSPDLAAVSPDTCMAILMFVQASINDLVQQWTPHLDFNLCTKCSCKSLPIPMDSVVDIDAAVAEKSRNVWSRLVPCESRHYIILNDADSILQQRTLRCELGNQVPMTTSLLCWFGEVLPVSLSPTSPSGDNSEYVTDEDINQVLMVLGSSWKDLGQTLGFNQLELERFSLSSHSISYAGKKMLEEWQTLHNKNATFFALLGALEIIQRRDIVDNLLIARLSAGDTEEPDSVALDL